MKNPSNSISRKGFTLIELLVVIAIIAVLAAAGFAGGSAAMNKARKVSAQASATSVATAIEQFYTEYSSLPSGSGTLSTASGGTGVKVLNILAGLETGSNIENDRKIRFLSLKEGKGTSAATYRDGVIYSSNVIVGLYDPWQQPYYIELDENYEERLEFTPQGLSKVTLNGRRAAVYSLGVPDGDKPSSATLVKTW